MKVAKLSYRYHTDPHFHALVEIIFGGFSQGVVSPLDAAEKALELEEALKQIGWTAP
jgi:hypothetical protein